MKISKVNHVKTGVFAKPAIEGGMLYDYPSKEGGSKDLRKHIEEVNRKAQILYNVFNQVKEKDKKQNSVKDALKIANAYINSTVIFGIKKEFPENKICNNFFYAVNRPIRLGKENVFITSISVSVKEKSAKESAEYIVNNYLRNSLRRDKRAAETIVRILTALYDGKNYEKLIKKIEREDLAAVVSAVSRDYLKDGELEKIAVSIEKQKVLVQVGKDGYLIPSGAEHEKKAYIFNFMKKYAESDEEGQRKMLNHMKDLIRLYYTEEEVVSSEILDLINSRDNTPFSQKDIIRSYNEQIAEKVSAFLVERYQKTLKDAKSEDEEGWVRYISDKAEKLLSVRNLTQDRIHCDYLFKKTWEEWTSFIAKKYIDLGKATYNFAMGDISKVSKGESAAFGTVNEGFETGISSFDYERMKAEDSLNRAMIKYISFAVNIFDASVRNPEQRTGGKEDILLLKPEKIVMYEDAVKRVLRYFGGISKFSESSLDMSDKNGFFTALKDELYVARNYAFHYVTGEAEKREKPVVTTLLDTEYALVGSIFRKKYFSNNVPMFYRTADIDNLMSRLYKSNRVILAQMPSFNKVLSRKAVVDFVNAYLAGDSKREMSQPEISEQFRSSFYFLLKEIYYYDFILKEDLLERFKNGVECAQASAIKKENNSRKHDAMKKAYRDFMSRADKLTKTKGITFGQFCQEIMTEYNQQNSQKQKKPSAVEKTYVVKGQTKTSVREVEDKEQIYKHYRTLLYAGIREAFLIYLKEEAAFGFLRSPKDGREKFRDLKEEDFSQGWTTECYTKLKDAIIEDKELSSWYVTAHFMNQKHLNHLIGEIKNYVQFIGDIEKRAKVTGNRVCSTKEKVEKYTSLLEVLEFCKLFCGQVSNNLEDYFANNEEYAKYVAGFVDYGGTSAALLQAFCRENKELNYYDELNPIPNRNIILSLLYGNTAVLSSSMKKVTLQEVKSYQKNKESLSGVFKNGACKDENEQRKMSNYQKQKNRIEFVDVLTLTELLNDLYGQLISYSYLRERDLMFMQLGFYYIKLFHTSSVPAQDKLRVLSGDCDIKDGAVLYQIAAMYSYDLPIYGISEKGKAVRKNDNVSPGIKIPIFVKAYCGDKGDIYMDGLYFFEDVDRHDDYIDMRNYIDHFKYFADHKKSILDLYSDLYNGFFSYDTKLKKSMSFVLPNILLSHFVNAKLSYERDVVQKNNESYRCARIVIREKDIKSDFLTYKDKENLKAYYVPARNDVFLKEVLDMISLKR